MISKSPGSENSQATGVKPYISKLQIPTGKVVRVSWECAYLCTQWRKKSDLESFPEYSNMLSRQ